MSKEIRLEKTEQCTIYIVGISDKYRIVQTGEESYIVEGLFKETRIKGYLWWKKKISENKWTRVDKYGNKRYAIYGRITLNNFSDLVTYKTKYGAENWIKTHKEYPIYH